MSPPVPDFSHIVDVRDLPQNGADYDISANEPECAGLAERFGLVRIDGFNAKLRLEARARGAVRLSGRVTAKVTHTCVVTLDLVEESVDVELDIVFRRDFEELAPDGQELINEADFEPLAGDSLDIGGIIAEEMALSLNPYPRAATAPMIGPDGGETLENLAREKPFAALEALLPKDAKI